MQKTIIIGYVGNDAAVRQHNGQSVINFNVAVNQKYINKETGEEIEKNKWFSVSHWSDKAGIAGFLDKGKQVYVEGEISDESYTDKAGFTQVDLKIKAYRIELLGKSELANSTKNEIDKSTKHE